MIVYLEKSDKKDKKYKATIVKNDNNLKCVYFGAAGYSDYTKHKDKERMERYNIRHKKRENWNKSGILTAGFWSKWILWSKPSFKDAKSYTEKKFNIVIKSSKPPKSNSLSNFKRKSPNNNTMKIKSPKRKSRSRRPPKNKVMVKSKSPYKKASRFEDDDKENIPRNIMSHFNTTITNYSVIPIKDIDIDQIMERTIKSYGYTIDGLKLVNNNKLVGDRLTRIDNMINLLNERKKLPPVVIEKQETGGKFTYVPKSLLLKGVQPKYIPITTTYSIIDGRHRVVGSIIKGYKYVPVIFKSD